MDDFLEFLYDLMPPWLATVIAGGISLVAGIIGSVWHSHEQTQLDLCNSTQGQFDQVVNGAAHTSCGTSSLFSTIARLLEIAGYIGVVVFAIVFVVLAARGNLMASESSSHGGGNAGPIRVNRPANRGPAAVKCIAVPRHAAASNDHCAVCFPNSVSAQTARDNSAANSSSGSITATAQPAAVGCIAVPRHVARSSTNAAKCGVCFPG